MRIAAGFVVAILLAGSLQLRYADSSIPVRSDLVELRFGALVAGSTAGANYTNAQANVTGTLLSTRTDALYLNNTNASGPYYAKLVLVTSSGVSNLISLTIGIDNGTASTAQITASLGSLTQTAGAYVRLEASTTNKIYVTRQVALVGPDSAFTLTMRVADDTSETAYVITDAAITVT